MRDNINVLQLHFKLICPITCKQILRKMFGTLQSIHHSALATVLVNDAFTQQTSIFYFVFPRTTPRHQVSRMKRQLLPTMCAVQLLRVPSPASRPITLTIA